MKTYIHHVALNVSDLPWYQALFQEVFEMTVRKCEGQVPNRKVWFCEGIQLNEVEEPILSGQRYDHIALTVCDVEKFKVEACQRGCKKLPDQANWILLPNGVTIELMAL